MRQSKSTWIASARICDTEEWHFELQAVRNLEQQNIAAEHPRSERSIWHKSKALEHTSSSSCFQPASQHCVRLLVALILDSIDSAVMLRNLGMQISLTSYQLTL